MNNNCLLLKKKMTITTTKKPNNTSYLSRKVSAASTNVIPVIFDKLKQLMQEKLKTIEDKINSVQKHVRRNKAMLKLKELKTDERANHATSNILLF